MKNSLFAVLAFFFMVTPASAQKPVSGMFLYKASVSSPDSASVLKQWAVRVYTNDTIVRVETETDNMGQQVYIRHMELDKAYLLIGYNGKNYAIQTDLAENRTKDTVGPRYTVKRKFGGKKVAGYRCRKYYVLDRGRSEGYYCYFAKQFSNKYLEVYPEVPNLAADYYLPSQDGLIHYELQNFTPELLSRDLFGIPSDYKRITFEEFIHLFPGGN